jgi:23S rRNA pseudouridine2605 synthase
LIVAGRVKVNGKLCREPDRWIDLERDRFEVDTEPVRAADKVYLMLNKPRGLVTTADDEHGRATVFDLFEGSECPNLCAVGRLDKASEGLLLFTNDTDWAANITAPETKLEKIYHVQISRLADDTFMKQMRMGAKEQGDFLAVKSVTLLRSGSRNSWLEVVLTEGKNRHIRRLLSVFGVEVLRLVRVSIGPLQLGTLNKGAFRHLTSDEVRMLSDSL